MMYHDQTEESTIDLWDDGSSKNIELRDRQSGKTYSFVLKRSFVIGRDEIKCDLQITKEDRYISGKHLRFVNEEGEVYVEDLDSRNGTRLNGKPLVSMRRIRTGDILRLGRTELQVKI